MEFLLRTAILWIAIFGYTVYSKKYIHVAFTPILILSLIGVLMFLAGLLNVMLLCICCIIAGGWICLASEKPWTKSFYKENTEVFVVFLTFSLLCGLFLIRLYGQIPTHYDCFSHWLLVIRDMIKTDHMPNFNSQLIGFQGYPTGSAGFVYFICTVLGNSRDDLILFVQSILYAAAMVVFMAFFKRKDVMSILIAIVGALFCIVANSSNNAVIDDLLVDTLISMISIAVVAIVVYYKDDLMFGVLASLPLQIFLIAIKNSGILMVVINTALIVLWAVISDCLAKRKFSLYKLMKLGAITAGIPAAVYYLWLQHVKYVFNSGVSSKHTASFENYAQTLGAKTAEEIEEILTVFYERFTSWNHAWFLLVIVSCILLIGALTKKYLLKKPATTELLVFLGVWCAYLAFMVVLALMYLLSMPYEESIVLASYDRYEYTILVYIIGVMTIYSLSLVSMLSNSTKAMLIKVGVLLVFLLTLVGQKENLQKLVMKEDTYTNSSRYVFEQLISENNIEEGKSYFIYGNRYTGDAGYHYFLTRYLFWSTDIQLCEAKDLQERKEYIGDYDYLIIVDYDESIHELLESQQLETNKNVYRAKEVFQ